MMYVPSMREYTGLPGGVSKPLCYQTLFRLSKHTRIPLPTF